MVGGISAKRTSFAKAVGRPPNWINSKLPTQDASERAYRVFSDASEQAEDHGRRESRDLVVDPDLQGFTLTFQATMPLPADAEQAVPSPKTVVVEAPARKPELPTYTSIKEKLLAAGYTVHKHHSTRAKRVIKRGRKAVFEGRVGDVMQWMHEEGIIRAPDALKVTYPWKAATRPRHRIVSGMTHRWVETAARKVFYAVHKARGAGPGKAYSVTHVPSGLAVAHASTLTEARDQATIIHEYAQDAGRDIQFGEKVTKRAHECRALGSLDIRGGVFDSMNVVAVRR
jgi:hypothetical protein